MSRESAIVFNDGSIESKVLQHELKTSYDLQVIDVPKYEDLQKWVEKAIEYTEGTLKGILKIILHFPIEDYIQKDIRDQIMAIQEKNPNLRIIAWYEQASREGLKNRAENYGIIDWKSTPPPEPEQVKPTIDPDDEMKNIASDIIKESKKTVSEHLDYNLSQATKPKKKRKWNI